MSEVLFRGKIKSDNGIYKKGDWVYGHYVCLKDGKKELHSIYGKGEIDIKTLGQFTGLSDKKGNKIFKGDIVEVMFNPCYVGLSAERIGNFEVVFNDGCYMKKSPHKTGLFHFITSDEHEVVGNIYDCPEILEEGVYIETRKKADGKAKENA